MEYRAGAPRCPRDADRPGTPGSSKTTSARERTGVLDRLQRALSAEDRGELPGGEPEIETRGSSRHARWPTEIRSGPSAEIFPVASCVVVRAARTGDAGRDQHRQPSLRQARVASPRKCAHLRSELSTCLTAASHATERPLPSFADLFPATRISRGRGASAVVSGGGGSRTRGDPANPVSDVGTRGLRRSLLRQIARACMRGAPAN